MKINKFGEFVSEKLSDFRKAELQSKNPDHPFLKAFKSDKDYIEIADLWDEGKREEAARAFRAKLVKMSNSKLGTSLILMVSGAALTSAGYNALAKPPATASDAPIPPKVVETPKGEIYTIKKGDCIWNIAKAKLGSGASNADILAYTKQISIENGFNWELANSIITKNSAALKDPDLIFPGGKLIINKFVK